MGVCENLRSVLLDTMEDHFGTDRQRIEHARSVLSHAEDILRHEDCDSSVVVIAAAILHDTGIPAAERKYGSSAGRFQQIEGPPIARRMMEEAGIDRETTDHVCDIIADHHSGVKMRTKEFRIVWDADWLVNIPAVCDIDDAGKIRNLVGRVFRTQYGKSKAIKLYLERRTT